MLPTKRSVLIPPQELPGAGLYLTPEDPFRIPNGIGTIVFWATYSRGTQGGFPSLRVVVGNGVEQGFDALMLPAISVATPFGSQQSAGDTVDFPAPQNDVPVTLAYTWTIRGGVTTFNVSVAETGQPVSPGTIAITFTAGR